MHTLVEVLHKHISYQADVLCGMHLSVTDELPSKLPQFSHVETSCEFYVFLLLRKSKYASIHLSPFKNKTLQIAKPLEKARLFQLFGEQRHER